MSVPLLPEARRVTATAPAKINLHLAVGPLREDGYHDLVTVFRAVDLWERVTVERADADAVEVTGRDRSLVPVDRTNLAARAVDLVRAAADVDEPVAVSIAKGVPVAGGMAGGSADAAAALVAADRLLGLGASRDELAAMAAELGSDVPFCLHGGTMLGTGRGELLTPVLHATAPLHVVIATSRDGLSTPAVFAELDRLRAAGEAPTAGDPDALLEALRNDDPAAVAAAVANDLEAPALSLRPDLRGLLAAGREAGAAAALLSGSGPTCVFFCAGHDDAVEVAAGIAERGLAREVRVVSGPVAGAHVTAVE